MIPLICNIQKDKFTETESGLEVTRGCEGRVVGNYCVMLRAFLFGFKVYKIF